MKGKCPLYWDIRLKKEREFMNIITKALASLVLLAGTIHNGIECRRFILINNDKRAGQNVKFRLTYSNPCRSGWDKVKDTFGEKCYDDLLINVGSRGGAWRIETGNDPLEKIKVPGAEVILKDHPEAYGVVASYDTNGKPILKVYNQLDTKSQGYAYEDWDEGRGH